MGDVRNPWNAPVVCIRRESLPEIQQETRQTLGMSQKRVERGFDFLVENGLVQIVDERSKAE
jgi:hypothetical protein